MRRLSLLLLLLVPLAAGCGTEQGGLSGSDQDSKDAGSSRIEMSLVGAGSPFDGYSATGAIDYAHERGDLVMTSKTGRPGVQALIVGHDTYVGMKMLGQERWLKQPESDISGPQRFVPGPSGPGPDQLLSLLTESSKRVETVGREAIRGTPTKHYRAHLDKAKLGEHSSYLPDDLVVDAWVDDNGLVRRIRVPLGGQGEPVYIVDLYDFGVDVNVKPPPDDEIVSEKEFSKLFERECQRERRDESSGESPFCLTISGSSSSGSDSAPGPGPDVTVPTTTEGK